MNTHWSKITQLSWDDFLLMVANRHLVQCWIAGSLREEHGTWQGTATMRDCVELMRKGWSEGAARVQRGLAALHAEARGLDQSKEWHLEMAGAFPSIPDYLGGELEHMWQQHPVEDQRPILRVFVPGFVSASLLSYQVENYGLALLAWVDAQEAAGRSIELVWHASVARTGIEQGDLTSLQIVLKKAGENYDLDRLAFAMAHPSMFRRACWAAWEILGWREIGKHYGYPLQHFPDWAREPGAIYLPTAWAMGERGELNSAARALECMQERMKAA